ncbi:MAG TPA: hypothetical protein VGJ70_11720 [Solirubrobacteraceae bacterium]|jgi:hypothetical protein
MHARVAAALASVVPVLCGCFTAEVVLRRDGSGMLELSYVPGRHATIDSEAARFSSPHVIVRAVEPRPGGAMLRAEFDDVTKLSTAEGFRVLTVVRGRRRDREALRFVIRNPEPKPFTDHGEPWPRIALTLPGPVLAATQGGVVSARRVVWRVPIAEYVTQPHVTMSVRWRTPSDDAL